MAIRELDDTLAQYPELAEDLKVCDDPRHNEGDGDEAVAVVETRYCLYAVCDACLARIQQATMDAQDRED